MRTEHFAKYVHAERYKAFIDIYGSGRIIGGEGRLDIRNFREAVLFCYLGITKHPSGPPPSRLADDSTSLDNNDTRPTTHHP